MSTNSLIHEQSPYLLQHAHNPVDWLPWGDKAFAKAKAEDKPIFLSVGYSTCHWCHVMERESFESEEIAALLNRYFVSVKVDREERPDVDRIYMTFVQAVTQSGGWPMSVWLTPEGKPFYGGTYFPPDNRYGRPGFAALLQHLAQSWQSDRPRIMESSEAVLRELSQQTAVRGGTAPTDIAPAERCYATMQRSFDREYGGFGSAPKFPRPVALHFLFRYTLGAQEPHAQEMALATLRAMAAGGMHDQLGGGFHRYSVDERWFVPHFEKMLYDQAQLASSYLEAYQLTHDTQYAATARKIFAYVLRDMTHPTGAFYCAEDADSIINADEPKEKGEGAFYIWSYEEWMAVLGQQTGEWLAEYYGVEERGNVANDPHQEFTGRNILAISMPLPQAAARAGVPAEQAEAGLAEAQQKLLSVRAARPRPHLDDKILTSWNAMMISAFASGARVLQSEEYAQAATRALSFLRQRLWQPETGVLLRRYREGDAAISGFLDDYALLAQAALDVFTLDSDPGTLTFALQVIDAMRMRFEDREQGGFYSSEPAEDLVLRLKDDYDGAEPSGNSAAAVALVRAGRLCERQDLLDSAERVFAAFSSRLQQSPLTIPYLVAAWMESQSAPQHIVLTGQTGDPLLEEMQEAVASRFLPQASVLQIASEEQHGALQTLIPLLQQLPYTPQATAYVCQEYACRLPVHAASDLAQLLGEPSVTATR